MKDSSKITACSIVSSHMSASDANSRRTNSLVAWNQLSTDNGDISFENGNGFSIDQPNSIFSCRFIPFKLYLCMYIPLTESTHIYTVKYSMVFTSQTMRDHVVLVILINTDTVVEIKSYWYAIFTISHILKHNISLIKKTWIYYISYLYLLICHTYHTSICTKQWHFTASYINLANDQLLRTIFYLRIYW